MSNNDPIKLSDDEKALVVNKKATCPFIASAVSDGRLPVRNAATNPLASIDDVRELGNTGGGDLGELLVHFATGNHALMRGESGKLDTHTPNGFFSLEFPGSQGSHQGHSGILQGDPTVLDSGRLSEEDFARLISRQENGLLKRSDVAHFIAENLRRDPRSKVLSTGTLKLQGQDLLLLAGSEVSNILSRVFGSEEEKIAHQRDIEEKLTKLGADDNLMNAAGEFGLLFAFFANKPGAVEVDGEPTLAVDDLRSMFVEKRLPAGWDTWEKSSLDWVRNTHALARGAARACVFLTQSRLDFSHVSQPAGRCFSDRKSTRLNSSHP